MIRRLIHIVAKLVAPIWYAKWIGVDVGEECRLIKCEFSTEPYLVRIGNHVSATCVRFETHDGGVWCIRDKYPDIDVIRSITVGNNVYIGYQAVLLPGTVIEDNVVIGARAVVRGTLEANSVYAGVPARRVKSIEEYAQQALSRSVPTKGMSAKKKRDFLKAFSSGER